MCTLEWHLIDNKSSCAFNSAEEDFSLSYLPHDWPIINLWFYKQHSQYCRVKRTIFRYYNCDVMMCNDSSYTSADVTRNLDRRCHFWDWKVIKFYERRRILKNCHAWHAWREALSGIFNTINECVVFDNKTAINYQKIDFFKLINSLDKILYLCTEKQAIKNTQSYQSEP